MTNRRAATASAIRLARRGATSRGETDLHAYALEKSLASIGVTFAHVRNLRTFPLLAHRCIFSALFRGPLYYSYPQGKGTAYGAYGGGWRATRSAGAGGGSQLKPTPPQPCRPLRAQNSRRKTQERWALVLAVILLPLNSTPNASRTF